MSNRFTVILAVLFSALIFSAGCVSSILAKDIPAATSTAQLDEFGAVEVGSSLIGPESNFYFLKIWRERIEVFLAGSTETKVVRELEFAQRRLREVRGLVKDRRQDLIEPVMKRYEEHMRSAAKLAAEDRQLQIKVAEATARHLDVLTRVYDEVGNITAKSAILGAIERSAEHNSQLLARLEDNNKKDLVKRVTLRHAQTCKFLSREASNSGLVNEQQQILKRRVESCKQDLIQMLQIATSSSSIN